MLIWKISRVWNETNKWYDSRSKLFCVSRVKVAYNEEKIKSLKKIAFIQNNFLETKKDMQLCVDFDQICKDFQLYHYKKTFVTGFGNFK